MPGAWEERLGREAEGLWQRARCALIAGMCSEPISDPRLFENGELVRLQGEADEQRAIGRALHGDAARTSVEIAQGLTGLVKRSIDDDAVGAWPS